MTECISPRPYNFYQQRQLVVRYSDLELSSDAGILLARQAEEQEQICRGLAECIEEWRDTNKVTHSLHQLVSQRVYQLVGGYEDANDSNILRHDPIYKISCERLPIANEELLASQPTITRMENQVKKPEVAKMRSRMVDGFIAGYQQPPAEIVLDIDGWADPTHGQQQLSCFHGYYGQHMYFPVLINEAKSGYPLVLQLRAGNIVLTNLDLPPQQLYDQFYVQRGSDSEHRIKELKLGIHADRLSCSSFIANQFRLLLSQAAYILLLRIRQAADGTEFATAQVERLRSMLIKTAAKVTVSARRVLVELARHSPFAAVINQISSRLQVREVVDLY